MLSGLEAPAVPGELGSAVIDAIEKRHDANAAAVLAALAALAVEPLAAQARGSADRLAGEGIVSGAAPAVGTLTIEESVQIEVPGAELTVGAAGPPRRAEPAKQHARGASAGAPQRAAADTARAARASARRRARQRGRGGSADRLPRADRRPGRTAPARGALPMGGRGPGADRRRGGGRGGLSSRDGDAAGRARRARASDPSSGRRRLAARRDFVASTMLQWKGGYDDGRLGRWTRADLAEYLLDYFPRKVSVDQETLHAVPECVRAFLGFLDARGSLSGAPLEQLEQTCEALREDFEGCARDGSRWGLAKSLVMRMQAEGIDPDAPEALDAFIMTSTPGRARSATRSSAPPPTVCSMSRGCLTRARPTLPRRHPSAARPSETHASATGEADPVHDRGSLLGDGRGHPPPGHVRAVAHRQRPGRLPGRPVGPM